MVHVFQSYDFGGRVAIHLELVVHGSGVKTAERSLTVCSLGKPSRAAISPPVRPIVAPHQVAPKLTAYAIAKELQARGLPITELIEGPTYKLRRELRVVSGLFSESPNRAGC